MHGAPGYRMPPGGRLLCLPRQVMTWAAASAGRSARNGRAPASGSERGSPHLTVLCCSAGKSSRRFLLLSDAYLAVASATLDGNLSFSDEAAQDQPGEMDSQVLTAVATALGSAGLSSGPQPVLPGFLNSLASPLEHYGLWALFLLVLVEDFGIPLPGETVLITAAIFAGSGRLNVVMVGLVGFGAAIIGDNIGYAIGRFGGRLLVERWGGYVFLTAERLKAAEAFFDRQGGKIIVIARFVEGLRQANGIIAGIIGMHWLRFIAFNALGAALWVGTWVSVGYFAGQHITTIYNDITTYSLYAAIAAVVLIAAWIAYRLRKRHKAGTTTAKATDK